MEFTDVLFGRRSIRAYTERKLSRQEIDRILTAGINAPNARNIQSWHFYAITNESEKAKLTGVCADWVLSAPVVFVICTDGNELRAASPDRAERLMLQDTALAMENMLLMATDMGLGGCIIGAFDVEGCRKAFDIPQKYAPVALLPIGEPAAQAPAKPRKPLCEVVTYLE